ncbi:hypothetical protein BKA67DRAFT_541292 [Truncatella angustata]|uniref:Uncharacterized protein n=1 Tax=Truncatella angustata TaxID=152316 RepID=A0A9P8UBN7_9PEZI|nr:uncharacterized protein BKA67DRAFT_541292 [Truncatella angustata]KAH6646322.1 hypothetical protein BKA67DRAFT_541292 [Truncatella angustata]
MSISSVSDWGASTYGEDDYGVTYSSYPYMSQEPVQLVPSYRHTSNPMTPAVYVDPKTPTYSYGNLMHRPATDHDLPALYLSGMAAPLPTPDRLPTIDRTSFGAPNIQAISPPQPWPCRSKKTK